MTDDIVGTESSICFQPEESYYGSSPIDETSEEIEVIESYRKSMADNISISMGDWNTDVELEIEVESFNFETESIDAEDIIQELEETDEEEVNFVEENTLMVGY